MAVVTQVSVKMPGGSFNLMAKEAYKKLPVNEQVNLLMAHRLTFLDDTGAEVPLKEAIASISKEKASRPLAA